MRRIWKKIISIATAAAVSISYTSVIDSGISLSVKAETEESDTSSQTEWIYSDELPADVTIDMYDIEYRHTYCKAASSSPGDDWIKGDFAYEQYENVGEQYTSTIELETSETRELVSYYYYHYCGNSGNLGNYEYNSTFTHFDSVNPSLVYSAQSGPDETNPAYTYHYLKWNSNNAWAYCESGTTCDGSFGTHGKRCFVWYKNSTYQDKQRVEYYNYTTQGEWTDVLDSTAESIEYRYRSNGIIATGVCGDTDVEWSLSGNGTLTLSGTGSHGSYAPWLTDYRNDIERVVIESGVTNVGYSAFGQCPNLENVTIADTVTEIDDYAFYGCDKLSEVVIPEGVTSVGDYAFINCPSITEIVIPKSVTSLGTQAFKGCDSLTDIYFINPDCEIYDSEKTLPEGAVLYGGAGSTAEAYAYTYDREFVEYTLIASGACGDRGSNVIWKLDSAGKLIVSGNGDMEDYKWEQLAEYQQYEYVYNPWCDYRNEIKSVIIEDEAVA